MQIFRLYTVLKRQLVDWKEILHEIPSAHTIGTRMSTRRLWS
jgi:hypothetical protein